MYIKMACVVVDRIEVLPLSNLIPFVFCNGIMTSIGINHNQ